MSKEELRRKWKVFFNGLLQAVYSGVTAAIAVLVVNGVFVPMDAAAMGLVILGTILGHLIGYFQKSPLPDIFDVE